MSSRLRRSSARLKESGLSNCDFLVGDAYQLAQLAPRPVDFVFLANAFHGVPDRPRLAASVREALKPGGHFAIVNWHQRPREQTMVLGEPLGPKTDLRLSAAQTTEAVVAGGLTGIREQSRCRRITTPRCLSDRRPDRTCRRF